MPDRLNSVTIAMPNGDIEISWDAREAMLRELRTMPSAAKIVAAFEAGGASTPIKLSADQRLLLYQLLDEWRRRSSDSVPADVWALRNVLAYE